MIDVIRQLLRLVVLSITKPMKDRSLRQVDLVRAICSMSCMIQWQGIQWMKQIINIDLVFPNLIYHLKTRLVLDMILDSYRY